MRIDCNIVWEARDEGLSPAALELFLAILGDAKTRGTDGVVSRSILRRLPVDGYWNSLRLLVRSGWITEKDDGWYYVTKWDKWNDSQDDVYARRKADRQRKRIKNGIPPDAFRMPD
jgi:hypothetical protein